MATGSTKRKRARTAHLRQTDLSVDTGLKNARARFGANLKARRLERALTQTELAQGVELDQSTVAALEAGKYPPSFESVLRLAHALKSNPAKLFHRVKL